MQKIFVTSNSKTKAIMICVISWAMFTIDKNCK